MPQTLKSCHFFPETPGAAKGTRWNHFRYLIEGKNGGATMPVLLLWAVPAVIVVGGVGFYLVRVVQ